MINLKSNKNLKEILEYKKKLSTISLEKVEIVLFPSSPFLGFFYDVPYKIGSQNISIYDSGSHTGEILATTLASLKVSYTLVNHAEAQDTSGNIKEKIKNATKENIRVVLCIGETEETTIEKTEKELIDFINSVFYGLTRKEQENILLAYEPKWLIGESTTLNAEKLAKISKVLKKYMKDTFNLETSLLYGGGITPENNKNIAKLDNIDGFLIGNSANSPENIEKIYVNF